MGLFNLVPGWQAKLIDDPLDVRMTETLELGLRTARDRVHVVSGFLQSTIGGSYNKSTKTIQLHADAKYALVEEMRQGHEYLAPAAQAMAGFWGGRYNFELHFPNAAPMGRSTTTAQLADRESRWRRANLGFMARRKTKVVARRWHKRFDDDTPADPTTPVI